MNILDNIEDKRTDNKIEQLFFDKGLRIATVFIVTSLDLLIVVLNNKKVMQFPIASYNRLKGAPSDKLNNWKLIGGGIGIEWEDLDKDLSLKGLIQAYALSSTLQSMDILGLAV